MAVKISDLPSATSVSNTDVLPVNAAGTTSKITFSDFKASMALDKAASGRRLGINAVTPTSRIVSVEQDTTNAADRGPGVTLNVSRTVGFDEGLSNPKALRVKTVKNVNSAQTEWAISGEIDTYSSTQSSGDVAVSGTANKYAAVGAFFAGHFNAIDRVTYNNANDTTGIVGIEVHSYGWGPDHPSVNNGLGLRITLDVVGRTVQNSAPAWQKWQASTAYSQYDIRIPTTTTLTEGYSGFYYVATTGGTSGAAEPTWPTTVGATVTDGSVVWTCYKGSENGCGIRVRNERDTNGWFRVGIAILDDLTGGNPNHMETALQIRTGGRYGIHMPPGGGMRHTVADILLEEDSNYGIICAGNYTAGAIRINSDQFLAWSTNGAIKARYNSTTSAIEWQNGSTVRASINLSASPFIQCATFRNSSADVTLSTVTSGNVVLSPAGDIRWNKPLVALGGGATATLGTIGGSGPTTAAQNSWLRVLDSTGAACWIPVWK